MSFVPYNLNIPFATNSPSSDQPLMEQNTNAVNTILGIDHINFNNANGGYHTIIHQPPQSVDPAAIVGIGQTYTKTLAGDQQLFYESGGGVITQLTASLAPTPTSPNNMTTQNGPGTITGTSISYLPGGLIIFYGKITNVNTTSSGQAILFPGSGFPNNAFLVLATPTSNSSSQNASVTVKSGTLSQSGVTIFCPTNNINSLFWVAIGN